MVDTIVQQRKCTFECFNNIGICIPVSGIVFVAWYQNLQCLFFISRLSSEFCTYCICVLNLGVRQTILSEALYDRIDLPFQRSGLITNKCGLRPCRENLDRCGQIQFHTDDFG